jgi:dTDP-4-dehydrorhamnose 3,5-epimerase
MTAHAPQPLKVNGAWFVARDPFVDDRGVFMELNRWHDQFHQANFSRSKYGVIRGMHVQHKDPQGKLIVCVQGELLDVVHDLRSISTTFGTTDYRILRPGMALYCPPGTAHGFQCLTKTCEIVYLCTSEYDKESDTGFRYLDANAPWQKDIALLSKKDVELPGLAELLRRHEWMS